MRLYTHRLYTHRLYTHRLYTHRLAPPLALAGAALHRVLPGRYALESFSAACPMRRSLACLALLAAPAALAQPGAPFTRDRVTAEDYARAERFLAPAVISLLTPSGAAYTSDGRVAVFTGDAAGRGTFGLVDARTGRTSVPFDAARLAAALGAALGRPVSPDQLPFQTFDLDAGGRTLAFAVQGRAVRCDLPALAACTLAPAPAAAPRGAEPVNVAPDGSKGVFIRDHNLFLRDLRTGAETRLTSDGVDRLGYATDNAGWTHSDNAVGTWSLDGRRFFTFQHDSRGVGKWHMTRTRLGRPELDSWAYPLPGDSVVFRLRRVVVEMPAGGAPARVVRLQMPEDAHRSTVSDHVSCGGAVCDAQWLPDVRRIAFLSSSRDHKQLWFRLADAETGAVRTVFDETSATQLGDASFPDPLWQVLPETNELVWWSQKEGWTHLYLVDLASGRVKNRITSGEGNVTEIVKLDARARQLYVMAQGKERGRDPYFQHLYRVGLDGRGWTLLTPDDAHHAVELSPDGRTFLDRASTPDTPAVTTLRELRTGRAIQTVGRQDVSRLRAAGWQPPARVTVKARDGQTDLYGLMFTPTTLDRTRRYPVVVYIYPGPQTGSVGSRAFSPVRSDHQALAELGFVVVAIDGMGTPGRSKAFADAYYGNMIDNTLPDQIAGVRDLARQFAFVDTSRVGIWGHSGGGYATAAAMFRHGAFFKVGVSQSGNHDNRLYEDDWGERYQGLLQGAVGPSDSYAAHATPTYAAGLRGKLFLVHGMMDDNVPPENALAVVDALVKANRDFDLLLLPHARHGYAGQDGRYVTRRRWDYFVRHLLGAEPPREYALGQPRR